MIIADADILPLLEKMVGKIPTVRQVIVATEEGFEGWSTDLPNPIDYEDFIEGQLTNFDWPQIDENSPLGLCYTSGTTVTPRALNTSTARNTYTSDLRHDRFYGAVGYRFCLRHRAHVPRNGLGNSLVVLMLG